jgi:hypothetical protein
MRQLRYKIDVHAVHLEQARQLESCNGRCNGVEPGAQRRCKEGGLIVRQGERTDLLVPEKDEVGHHRHRDALVVPRNDFIRVELSRSARRDELELVHVPAGVIIRQGHDNALLLVPTNVRNNLLELTQELLLLGCGVPG